MLTITIHNYGIGMDAVDNYDYFVYINKENKAAGHILNFVRSRGWLNLLKAMVEQEEKYRCPNCGQPWPETEAILPDGTLGCSCRKETSGDDLPEHSLTPRGVDKARCICVDFLNFNPDPVANPDCPLHGAGFATNT